MRRLLSITLMIVAAAFIVSCSESNGDESTEFTNWQNRNDEYFNKIYQMASDSIASGNTSWKIINKFSNDTTTNIKNKIVVKVIEPQSDPNDTVVPLSSDTISVHYAGYLMPTESYNSKPYTYYPTNVGYNFDKSWYDKYDITTMVASKFLCSGTVTGFQTATMKMHKGERWMVYIPYNIGYGTTAQSSIPAYSTLIFDITVVNFWHPQVKN